MRPSGRGASLLSMLLGLVIVGVGAALLARHNAAIPSDTEAEFEAVLDDGQGGQTGTLRTHSAQNLVKLRMCRNDCTAAARACRALATNPQDKGQCDPTRRACLTRCGSSQNPR